MRSGFFRSEWDMISMVEKMKKSFYYQKLRENTGIIAWGLAMAAFCVLISYPGIFYSDSYARVETADKVRGAISMLFSGQRDAIEIRSWITVIPSFFMALSKIITGNIAGYTFLQAAAFFVLSLLFIKKIAINCKWLQYILFAINPLFYSEAIYYEAGVGCVIGIVIMVLILLSEEEKTRIDQVLDILFLIMASFIVFGYRANAFTIIPVILVYIIVQIREKMRKIWTTVAIIVGFSLVLAVPKVLNIDTMSSSMAGFVWEMLTTIDNMEPEKREEYIDYLDDFGKAGITERAVEANLEVIVGGFWSLVI